MAVVAVVVVADVVAVATMFQKLHHNQISKTISTFYAQEALAAVVFNIISCCW